MRGIRRILSVVVLIAFAGLLVASTATGRAQTAPSNSKEPSITPAIASVGTMLTGSNGSWTGTQPIVFAQQWLRCNDTGESCQKIAGETSSSYTVVDADVGGVVRFQVTASNAD